MIKISALFALVAACNALTVPQYFIGQQPLTISHQQPLTIAHQQPLTIAHQQPIYTHQPAYHLVHSGSRYATPVQFASVAAKPATVVSVAAPAPAPVIVKAAPAPEPFDANPQYSYAYKVSDALTGDEKEASETRDGDNVSGKYSVVEPDGSTRTVTYTADSENGFQATVEREAPKAPVAFAVVPTTPAPAKPAPVAVAAPAVQYVSVQHAVPAYHQYHPVQVQAIHHAPIQSIVQPHHITLASHAQPHYQYVLSHSN